MPTISIFYGIAVRMYLNDHLPPHFHAVYGEHVARFLIDSGDLTEGWLPKTAERLVREWSRINREALKEDWNLARACQVLKPIGGLDAE